MLLPFWSSATEKIRFNKPQVYPATAENRNLIEGISIKAALLTKRLYGDYLEVYSFKDNSQDRADFSLAINAVVDEDKCILCLTCVRSCPHHAMEVDREKGAAVSIPEACQKCGICAGECPAKAISLPVYSDDVLLSLI